MKNKRYFKTLPYLEEEETVHNTYEYCLVNFLGKKLEEYNNSNCDYFYALIDENDIIIDFISPNCSTIEESEIWASVEFNEKRQCCTLE